MFYVLGVIKKPSILFSKIIFILTTKISVFCLFIINSKYKTLVSSFKLSAFKLLTYYFII